MKAILTVILISLGGIHTSNAQVDIKIDANISHQTFSGWEAASFITSHCDPQYELLRDTILPYLIDSIGITRLRLEVRSGAENSTDHYQKWIDANCPSGTDTNYLNWRENRYANVNDNADTTIHFNGFHFTELDHQMERVILPFKNLLEARGISPYINLCYVAFTGQIKNGIYIHHLPEEYAEFVLAVHLHLKSKYNFSPDAWEVLLEPDNVAQWNGNLLGRAIVATSDRLLQYGFKPRFIAPSNTNMTNAVNYFDEMIRVPGVAEHLEEICYHRYSGVSQKSLQELASRGIQYGLKNSMLEWWFDNAKYPILHEDISIGNASSFQQATISGFFDINKSDPQRPIIRIKDISQYNRIYYTLIRPGAVRKGSSTSNQIASPVVVRNPDGRINLIVKVERDTLISIKDLPEGRYSILVTNNKLAYQNTGTIESVNGTISNFPVTKGLVAFRQEEAVRSTDAHRILLKIFPNPASDYIDISRFIENRGSSAPSTIRICDALGHCAIDFLTSAQSDRMDVSGLPPGMYFIHYGTYAGTFCIVR